MKIALQTKPGMEWLTLDPYDVKGESTEIEGKRYGSRAKLSLYDEKRGPENYFTLAIGFMGEAMTGLSARR